MSARLDYFGTAPELMKSLVHLETTVRQGRLPPRLIHLVKLRASQINGCAYCLHMHAREARSAGEEQARLDLLPAWREASCFSADERAALGWTEALTRIADEGAPDHAYEAVCRHFDEESRVQLTLVIGVINIWNRLAIGFRSQHPRVRNSNAA